jgi:hypothetical protein
MEKTKGQLLGEQYIDSMLDPNGSYTQYGLTKREYFAGLAMQGLLTRVPKRDNDKVDLGVLELKRIVEESILASDALLEELSKQK